jgi:spermidine synthase
VSAAQPGEIASRQGESRASDRWLAGALFFASGALGLGYQLVFVRKAALVVGASQIALSTVLTSFFLGMALGSYAVGRWLRSPRWSPLAFYGVFEIGIGVFALVFPLAFLAMEGLYAALYDVASASAVSLFALRFALLFVLFLPPTFLMGGTLPLLLDGLIARDREVGSWSAALYGTNVLGAVVGVLATSYFAIPGLGMNGTSRAAGLCNLAVGAIALAAFRRRAPLHAAPAAASVPAPRFFAIASFASGLAAIGYQIAWARWFALFATGNVHVTALLLAVYLAALAVGSLLLAALLRRGFAPLRVLALAWLLAPLLVFACLDGWRLAILEHGLVPPQGSYEIVSSWRFASETLDDVFVAPLLQVALVLFLPVVLLGMGLPALVAAATASAPALRAASGRLLFWNTLGSSAGGFALGYALIPAIGLGGALRSLALLSLGLGVAALARERRDAGGRGVAGWGLALAAASAAGCAWLGFADPVRRSVERLSAHDGALVELLEGPVATAAVVASEERLLLVSGNVRHATATPGEVSAQVVQGHLPALFYPREGAPRRALGIALGSGQAFGALLQHPIERMDVVDISPEIVSLAFAHFANYNYEIGRDPRVRLHLDDGRHFVDRAPDASYDSVLLEPAPPSHEGMHALYSLEFVQSVWRILREDGVFMQWLPLHFVTPNELRGIVATHLRVFPQSIALRSGGTDVMLLGFRRERPPRFPLAWLEQRLGVLAQEPRLRERRWSPACRHEALSLVGLLSLVLAGPEALASIPSPLVYRDDLPLLSYSSGDRWLQRRYEGGPLSRLTFSAFRLAPYARLSRLFEGSLPVLELEAERARVLEHFRVASAIDIALAEERFRRARRPEGRARAALGVAALHDRGGARLDALAWFRIALRQAPELEDPKVLSSVRRMARHRIAVERERLRSWLAELRPDERATPIAEAIADELRQHDERDAARRSGYLFD